MGVKKIRSLLKAKPKLVLILVLSATFPFLIAPNNPPVPGVGSGGSEVRSPAVSPNAVSPENPEAFVEEDGSAAEADGGQDEPVSPDLQNRPPKENGEKSRITKERAEFSKRGMNYRRNSGPLKKNNSAKVLPAFLKEQEEVREGLNSPALYGRVKCDKNEYQNELSRIAHSHTPNVHIALIIPDPNKALREDEEKLNRDTIHIFKLYAAQINEVTKANASSLVMMQRLFLYKSDALKKKKMELEMKRDEKLKEYYVKFKEFDREFIKQHGYFEVTPEQEHREVFRGKTESDEEYSRRLKLHEEELKREAELRKLYTEEKRKFDKKYLPSKEIELLKEVEKKIEDKTEAVKEKMKIQYENDYKTYKEVEQKLEIIRNSFRKVYDQYSDFSKKRLAYLNELISSKDTKVAQEGRSRASQNNENDEVKKAVMEHDRFLNDNERIRGIYSKLFNYASDAISGDQTMPPELSH